VEEGAKDSLVPKSLGTRLEPKTTHFGLDTLQINLNLECLASGEISVLLAQPNDMYART